MRNRSSKEAKDLEKLETIQIRTEDNEEFRRTSREKMLHHEKTVSHKKQYILRTDEFVRCLNGYSKVEGHFSATSTFYLPSKLYVIYSALGFVFAILQGRLVFTHFLPEN